MRGSFFLETTLALVSSGITEKKSEDWSLGWDVRHISQTALWGLPFTG